MTKTPTGGRSSVLSQRDGEPFRIAGIIPTHISDEGPHGFSEKNGFIGALERRYTFAQKRFEEVKFKVGQRGTFDDRVGELIIGDDITFNSPTYFFLITKELLAKIKAAQKEKGADLSQDELLVICLKDGKDAVEPNFTGDAMNAINASYYSSEVAFSKSAGLANIYAKNRPLNIALGKLIASMTGEPGSIRIKEIASGNETDHWRYIAKGLASGGISGAEVVLTDFVVPPVSGLSDSGLVIRSRQYSLLDEMPTLRAGHRFDVLITTYGFDSVWQPEDMSLFHIEDRWYRRTYRVKVADWSPRRKALVMAMRQARPLVGASAHNYDGIVVETAMEAVDISKHPFARYILKYKDANINFPGGMIKRVVEAFDTQLEKGGVFVVCDIGNFGFNGPSDFAINDCVVSGVAARFRADDYILAREILEKEYHFKVSLMRLEDLATQYLPEDWEESASSMERELIHKSSRNGVMVVRRASDEVRKKRKMIFSK